MLGCEEPNPRSESEQQAEAEEELLEEVPFSAAFIENDVDNPGDEESPEEIHDVTESVTLSRGNAITNAVEKASGAVVSIMATEPIRRPETIHDEFYRFFFGDQMPRENVNMGSGFVISEDGLIVTNQHVIGIEPTEILIYTNEGETFEAKLIGSDELTDLALLRIKEDRAFPYVEFSDSDEIMVGEWAIALGNPFGLFDDGQPTVTVGVVSAINRDFRANPNNPRVYVDMIQTDAAINRGNSGGPLLNSEGKVIGVNTFIYTGGTSAGFVGLGFAIPSNRVDRIISQLLTSGVVLLDYDPGMDFTSMTEQLIYRYRLPYERGLLVTSVNKDGPAYECGIMPGDVIVKIGDERVISEMHARALFRDYEEGDEMPILLIRDHELYETQMKLRQKISADQ
ncbi:MAG: trypsin-like peptidase domain-containing protein [Balneolaceae bacterium]|nr:trypsin-like peptidase domain-containing protein [Balneolaceae bacterium]